MSCLQITSAAILLLLAAFAPAWPGRADKLHDDLDKLAVGLPKDAVAFVERRALCNHWQGEEPYDQLRAKEIDRALTQNKCDSIERDESILRARYADKPEIIKTLDAGAAF